MAGKKKRANGEGSVTKLPNGKFLVRVLVSGAGAGRKYKSVTCHTMREATATLNRLRTDKSEGVNIAPERMTLGQFLDQWLADVVKVTTRPTTYILYEKLVRLHIKPHLGHIQLTALRADQVQRVLAAKIESGLSVETVRRTRGVLRNALNIAIKRRLIRHNAAAETEAPTGEAFKARVLTSQESARLLEAAKDHRLYALFVLASLGLRQGELLGLRWEDVDEDARVIHIRQQFTMHGSMPHFGPPKTAGSVRDLPLLPNMAAALRAHYARQQIERRWNEKKWNERGLVFCNTYGNPLRPRDLLRNFHTILTTADLPHMRFHDLRHSAVSTLIAQGVAPKIVQAIVGHTNSQMTDRYTSVYSESMTSALASLDERIPQIEPLKLVENR